MSVSVKALNAALPSIPFQEASLDIWDKKYRLKSKTGDPVDQTIDDTYKRIARALADAEKGTDAREYWYREFLWALRRGVIPAGRITSNAGAQAYKPATSTINCTVSGTIGDSMDDILGKVHEAGLTLKAGCGIGYEFSTLRPRGAYVTGAGAHTSGPMSFMDIYDKMCFTVSSAGGRRGAQMATFDVSHPDVMDFIRAKRENGVLRQFNCSLLIADDFIRAVKEEADWPLVFPVLESEADEMDLNDPEQVIWREWPIQSGYVSNEEGLVACRIYKTVPAKRLWNMIMTSTYDYAEPGFILIDRVNEDNNNWWTETIRATNPCGEQPLPPYGSCWTGSMRLPTNKGLIRTHDAYALAQAGEQLLIGVDDVFSKNKTDLRPCTLVRNGEKEVFKVAFTNGQSIELTADHKVYTPGGWKEVQDLSTGDDVHVQSREVSDLQLIEPFDLGALKFILDDYEGDQIVVTRSTRRAFLKPLLDDLRINYFERAKGLYISRHHPVVRELERLDMLNAGNDALRGYLYAAQGVAARYKKRTAVYASQSKAAELANVLEQLGYEHPKVIHHGKETYRVLLPEPGIRRKPKSKGLDLTFGVYGWLLSDGWLTESTGLLFSDQDNGAMELLAPKFEAMTGTNGQLRKAYSGQQRDVYSLACYKKDAIKNLKKALDLEGGYLSRDIRVPEGIFRADQLKQASFLAAVFCADGGIDRHKLCIRLCSASRAWLEDIQLLMLSFGIHGVIQAQVSKGNAFYTLRLSQSDVYRYYRFIGFPFSTVKQEKLERLLAEKQRWRECDDATRVERVESIRSIGVQSVYDIEEYSTHTLVVNGVVVHNCLLGSVNLTRFVDKPFTEEASFNWDEYCKAVKVFTRMLDNVVEINGLPLEKQRREIEYKRRHGMGFLGLGSTLTMMRMKYGQPDSLEFAERVSREMAVAGWEAGLELAQEKGPAPIMVDDFEVTPEMLRKRPEMVKDGYKAGDRIPGRVLHARYSRYMQKVAEVAPELVEQLAETGARFTHHTSIAPTGTISLSLANNASNGIEPSFAHHYNRNVIREGKKSKEKVSVYSYELLAYKTLVNPKAMPFSEDPEEMLPDYFLTAETITPKEHVAIQAAAQKWIDSSISKTANVPTDYPYEDFKDIYLDAWEQGLKGCTTFRFNPEAFQGVLVTDKDLENTTYVFELEDGSQIELKGGEEVEYDGEVHTAANLFDALKEGYYGKF